MTVQPGTLQASEVSVAAAGLIGEFANAGILAAADVQVARTLCRLGGDEQPRVQLAVALTVRALRLGSVCLDLSLVRDQVIDDLLDPALLDAALRGWEPPELAAPESGPPDLGAPGSDSPDSNSPDSGSLHPDSAGSALAALRERLEGLAWPEPADWLGEVTSSALVGESAQQPLRIWQGRLYLTRYAVAESGVVDLLGARVDAAPLAVDEVALRRTVKQLFPERSDEDPQSLAAHTAVVSRTTVVAGGPGTGKTTTVAAMLAAIQAQYPHAMRVALSAPTGRAARRLGGAVAERANELTERGLRLPEIPTATTLHRLLGWRGPGRGFRFGPNQLLPYDVIVVDEMSMVALPMAHHLLAATPPGTRLIMVGDPDQLASVEAGQVMADLARLDLPQAPGDDASSVVTLTHNYRNSGVIDQVAQAIRHNDAERAVDLLTSGDPAARLVEINDPYVELHQVPDLMDTVIESGVQMARAARAGQADAALDALDVHRVMCAHRHGPYGVARWGVMVRDAVHSMLPGFSDVGDFYPGRPVLANHNDPDLGVSNGDSGVVVSDGQGGTFVAFGDLHVPGWLLSGLTTLWAMTIHKAQGSQYPQVTVVLPPLGSPLLTRELLYTALTRAQDQVSVIGSIDAIRAAISTPTRRATGLGARWAQRATGVVATDRHRPDADDPAPF